MVLREPVKTCRVDGFQTHTYALVVNKLQAVATDNSPTRCWTRTARVT